MAEHVDEWAAQGRKNLFGDTVMVQEMQTGELTLEQSFKKYEEGMKLIKNCNDASDKAEKKLIVIDNVDTDE